MARNTNNRRNVPNNENRNIKRQITTNNRKPNKRGFLFYAKAILKNLGRNIKKLYTNLIGKNKRTKVVFVYVILILVLAISVFILTKKNAYTVILGEEPICKIKYDKELQPEQIQSLAINKLKAEVGTNVKVNEDVTFKKVHSSKKDLQTEDFAVNTIYKKYTYLIEGSTIVIDGVQKVTLKNQSDVDALFERIINQYVTEGSNLVEKEIITEYQIQNDFLNVNETSSVDEAFNILNESSKIERGYSVVSGDLFGNIASRNGLSMEELKKLNPGVDENRISIGQVLKIISMEPVISVKTVEEIKENKIIPKSSETRENDRELKGYKNILQEGKDGVEEAITKVISINGKEVSREVLTEGTVTVPAVNEITEIGTQ